MAAALAAILALSVSNARAEVSMDHGGGVQIDNGGGVAKPAAPARQERQGGGERRVHRGGGMPFGGLALGLLDLGFAYIEDSTTHYNETCLYVGGCKISVVQNPDEPPQKPKVEIRKKAPKPIRHVTDKRTGWTYYLAEDRNTGEQFIQIVDASGNDVHINGEVPMPGGGPIFPVR